MQKGDRHGQIRSLTSHLKGKQRDRMISFYLNDPSRIAAAWRGRLRGRMKHARKFRWRCPASPGEKDENHIS